MTRGSAATVFIAAAVVLGCSPFSSAGDSPPAIDGGAGQDAATTDAGSTASDGSVSPGEAFCSKHTGARWCFDFEGLDLGVWNAKSWTDDSLPPGTLVRDHDALVATVPGWPGTASAGRANVLLDAGFTSTLSFGWTFSAEETGNGSFSLIAEVMESPTSSSRIEVYTFKDEILVQVSGKQIKAVPKPATYPSRFQLDLKVVGTAGVALDISMDSEQIVSSHVLAWEGALTRAGFGLGQVDEHTAEPKGRRFRYDDVLVSTQ